VVVRFLDLHPPSAICGLFMPRGVCLLGQSAGNPYDLPYKQAISMGDTTFILITVAFFAVSIAYAYFCEKVR
jgi:hypothetical protein